jgi:hypothetical protein
MYLEQSGLKESRLHCIYKRMVLKDFMLGLLECVMSEGPTFRRCLLILS